MSRILVIDNYDSFVYTIVGYLQQLGAETVVVRNDDVADVPADLAGYDGVLVSPGPGTPGEAGASVPMIARAGAHGVPMLGVCLGHQALAECYGGVVTHAAELMHGKTSRVEHDGAGVLDGLPSPFTATRYHSLAVVRETVPAELEVTAWTGPTSSPIVMAVQHRDLPLYGVQFHPESVLTEGGHRLLANWLAITGDDEAVERSRGLAPLAPIARGASAV